MKFIDDFLNSITMYRLVLYYLALLIGVAAVLATFHLLPFSPLALLFSTGFLLIVCAIGNWIFAWAFDAPTNIESIYISALILALILSPIKSYHDLPIFFWAAGWTVASKFMFAIKRKHLFNPVAVAAVIIAFTTEGSATWWIGTAVMLPFVLSGLVIVRKVRRFDLAFYFFAAALATIFGFSLLRGNDLFTIIEKTFLDTPILFFAFVMITEPLTTPPTAFLQSIYGALVGFLFTPQLQVGFFSSTPELALVVGNLFSYAVSPKAKLFLPLKKKILANKQGDVYDFIFDLPEPMPFDAGQYLEWTLADVPIDDRGNRRYFTIASSPTEKEIRMGVRFYEPASEYKKKLLNLKPGQQIVAAQLSGDFTLPKDPNQKLVFIAGGIGVTPFRSMLKYLIDKKEKRDITLFFANKTVDEVVYNDVIDTARKKIGTKVYYLLSDAKKAPNNWPGLTGRLTPEILKKKVPDFMERTFYLSGPNAMVIGYEKLLANLGVKKKQIKVDYFPGFV